MEDMNNRRVRLLFEDKEGILSPSQKSEGFKRCWLLLKPQLHRTVADLTAHILHAFQLQPSCPHGLLLYMDGFTLPPFESTDILKNSDIISVRKKGELLSLEVNQGTALLQRQEVGNKQLVKPGTLFLANKEFEEESGGYLSDELEEEYREQDEEEEANKSVGKVQLVGLGDGGNATSKKRKVLGNINGSQRKKKCSAAQDSVQCVATAQQTENSSQDKVQSSQENLQKQKELDPKNEKQAKKGKYKFQLYNSNMEIAMNTKSSNEIQKIANEVFEGPAVTQKISRNARHKKAKRKWICELTKHQKPAEIFQPEGLQNGNEEPTKADTSQSKAFQKQKQTPAKFERKNWNDWKQQPAKLNGKEDVGGPKALFHLKSWSGEDKIDDERKSEEGNQNGNIHEQDNQQNDTDDEVIPVVIRPGHIRFEPLNKEQDVERSQKPRERFMQWNGITDKKKGQKWGKEKQTYFNKKDHHETHEVGPEVLTAQNETKEVGDEMLSSQNEIHLDNLIDFDNLPSLRNLPKAGDVIVYRLLELSSSWTPELSPFRVGQVSWCSSESGKLLLMPVPQYPITSKNLVEDESDLQQDNSLYKDNGSLQIDFSTLVDVRILKDGSEGLTASADMAPGSQTEIAASSIPSANNDKHSTPEIGDIHPGGPATEKGVELWEQFSEALSAKKAELTQENTWGEAGSCKKNSWSYRTLKGSALGPTMAFLRSNKKL